MSENSQQNFIFLAFVD